MPSKIFFEDVNSPVVVWPFFCWLFFCMIISLSLCVLQTSCTFCQEMKFSVNLLFLVFSMVFLENKNDFSRIFFPINKAACIIKGVCLSFFSDFLITYISILENKKNKKRFLFLKLYAHAILQFCSLMVDSFVTNCFLIFLMVYIWESFSFFQLRGNELSSTNIKGFFKVTNSFHSMGQWGLSRIVKHFSWFNWPFKVHLFM